MSTLAASPSVQISVEGDRRGGRSGGERRVKRPQGIRRALSHRLSPSTSSSIPSRYQTFYYSSSEAKGFSSKASRFQGEHALNDNPGPGSYSSPQSSLHTQPNSTSKRGSGGFASKALRFKREKREALGPGSYNMHFPPSRHDYSCSNVSSFFQKPIASKPEGTPHGISPSPTTYQPSHSHTLPNHLITAEAAFKSRSQRHSFPSSLAPSPGHYSIHDALLHPSPSPHSSAFSSKSLREGVGKPAKGPGPADYSPFSHSPHDPSDKHMTRYHHKHYLRMSAPAMPLPPLPPSPGPGHYETQAPSHSNRREATGSVFVSTTSRWRSEDKGCQADEPGPGTYDPDIQHRKSYLYNVQRKWI